MSETTSTQVVVYRADRDAEEQIERFHGPEAFEVAAERWVHYRRTLPEGPYSPTGGYCVWINDGDLWRRTGLLDDPTTAWAIRDRVIDAETEARWQARQEAERE
jgi:hypothetical protein